MGRALAFIVLMFVAILGVSALFFDSVTIVVIGVTMLIVSFFAGSAVVLGVITRRLERGNAAQAHDAEVISDEPED